MSKFAKWITSTATLLAIGLMLNDASGQVGRKPKIVPTVDPPKRLFPLPVDPRKPEPPRTNTLPVDPGKAKADISLQDFSFTTFRVVSIDEEMQMFVLERQGRREERTWVPGSCLLRGNAISFRLQDLRVGDTVAGISDQAAAGNLTSYLAVQEGSSKGSTLRACTIRDVNAEARQVQVSSYQVSAGGERIMSFPYIGARVFLNQRETPWDEIKAGDRGVMFFAQGNPMTHMVLHRPAPASEGTTTRRIEVASFSWGIVKGTVQSIGKNGTFVLERHEPIKIKRSSLIACTVGDHHIVNRNRVETWGGLRVGDPVSCFFDGQGLVAYSFVDGNGNKNRTLACGHFESINAEQRMVIVKTDLPGRPQESISLNFEELRLRKRSEGEMLDANLADFTPGTPIVWIEGPSGTLIELMIVVARTAEQTGR